MKKIKILMIILVIIIVGLSIGIFLKKNHNDKVLNEKMIKEKEEMRLNLINEIKSHYDSKVRIINDTAIYKKKNNDFVLNGKIYKGNIINLENISIDENTKYFYNNDLDIYLDYHALEPTKEEKIKDKRYKKYIVFNENIVTNDTYTIYDLNDTKLIEFKEPNEYPIIIKESDKFYIEFNDELVYINKSDVKEIVEHKNTDLEGVKSVPVLNYHFVYDPKETKCNQRICITNTLYSEHIKYLKANYLDLTMKEFELFMDKKINLPKSVLVTHDDGWLRMNAVKILDENEFHATYFLITSDYKKIESKYVESHSHTHNMHNTGVCKGGQGGGIRCLSEAKIQEDLKKSREALDNTTYFCYPFYEYNSYAVEEVKKAGFTLAFIGGNKSARPSDNHYLIPRYPIYNYMTVEHLKKMF